MKIKLKTTKTLFTLFKEVSAPLYHVRSDPFTRRCYVEREYLSCMVSDHETMRKALKKCGVEIEGFVKEAPRFTDYVKSDIKKAHELQRNNRERLPKEKPKPSRVRIKKQKRIRI